MRLALEALWFSLTFWTKAWRFTAMLVFGALALVSALAVLISSNNPNVMMAASVGSIVTAHLVAGFAATHCASFTSARLGRTNLLDGVLYAAVTLSITLFGIMAFAFYWAVWLPALVSFDALPSGDNPLADAIVRFGPALAVGCYLAVRLAFVAPHLAIHRRLNLDAPWKASGGRFWPPAVVLATSAVAQSGLSVLSYMLFSYVPLGAGLVQGLMLTLVLTTSLSIITMAIQAVALTYMYSTLTSQDEAPALAGVTTSP